MRKIIACLLMCHVWYSGLAQEERDSFLKEYFPVSIEVGGARYFGPTTSFQPEGVEFRYRNYNTIEFGVNYDFPINEKLNLKTGLTTYLIREWEHIRIDEEYANTLRPLYWDVEISTGDMFMLQIPAMLENFISIGNHTLTFNGGVIVGYNSDTSPSFGETSVSTIDEENFARIVDTSARSNGPLYFNGQVGVGTYIPFNGWMLRANAYYNRAFQNQYEGTFSITSSNNPPVDGAYSFRGDSVGLELSVYFRKRKDKDKP